MSNPKPSKRTTCCQCKRSTEQLGHAVVHSGKDIKSGIYCWACYNAVKRFVINVTYHDHRGRLVI